MHGIAAYPRRSGVVVPALLARAGCPVRGQVGAGAGDADAREHAGAETVAWMRGLMRRLPAEILGASLPDPGVMLRGWQLGPRTRGALARLGGRASAGQSWRVRDLVGATGLGPAALVDLLAAREENERHPSPVFIATAPAAAASAAPFPRPRGGAPAADRLDELVASLRDRLPLDADAVGGLVVSAGLARGELGVDDVVRLFRTWRMPVPFRVVRRSGATVLVAPDGVAAAEAVFAAASHFVFNWGLCTLRTVTERVRSLGSSDLASDAVARILAALPRFRWLHEESGWFSFAAYDSRLRQAIGKIFTVAERVPLRDLSLALSKRVKALASAPRRAIEAYLGEVVGCNIVGDSARPRQTLVAAPLEGSEALIVDMIRRSGGHITSASLREKAALAGIRLPAVRRFIRTSPLVIARAGRVHLLGQRSPPSAAPSLPAPARASAVRSPPPPSLPVPTASPIRLVPSRAWG